MFKKRQPYSLQSTLKPPTLTQENAACLTPAKRLLLFERTAIKPETKPVPPALARESTFKFMSFRGKYSTFSASRTPLLTAPAMLTETESFSFNNIKLQEMSKDTENPTNEEQQLKVEVILDYPSGRRHK